MKIKTEYRIVARHDDINHFAQVTLFNELALVGWEHYDTLVSLPWYSFYFVRKTVVEDE